MVARQTVGVVGLGLLGRGIAPCLLSRGLHVIGHTIGEQSRREARRYIGEAISDLVERGGIPQRLRDDWALRFTEAMSLRDYAQCDFVVESVVEDHEIKRSVFNELEAVLPPDVPIASNTSSLSITLLQQDRAHPGRFIGMHWAQPCHLTRFLEVIRGEQTDDATVAATMNLAEAAGKEPALVRRDIDGFIANRLAYAMFREAFHLLESRVADVETIDRAARNALGLWANLAGPFRWMDLSGLPVYVTAMQRLFPQLSCTREVPTALRDLVQRGAEGISNGQGFYQYTPEQARHWERLLVDNVWAMRALADRYFPQNEERVD